MKMRGRFADLWDDALSSLWFVPGLIVLAAFVLSLVIVAADRTFGPALLEHVPFLFGGTADAARSLLSTVAGSLVTVATLAFSVLIVALSQASAQFTPRVLRNFMGDRGHQVVLGSYIGTFTYALLVLREIRSPSEGGGAFVPALAVTTGIVLTLCCMGLLVYFLHHAAQSLQVATIFQDVHDEVLALIERLFPEDVAAPAHEREEPPATPPAARPVEVRATGAGFLRSIDVEQLEHIADADVHLVRVVSRIGNYVPRGAVIARIWATGPRPEERVDAVRRAFIFGRERTATQDALFGIRQIADIGIKALSPGINDPTTAEHALAHLGDIMGILASRPFPPKLRVLGEPPTHFWIERPDFAEMVATAFGQIRQAARENSHTLACLLGILAEVRTQARDAERADVICHEVREVLAQVPSASFTAVDQDLLRAKAEGILAVGRPAPMERPDDSENLPG